jgi:hypothetical protein
MCRAIDRLLFSATSCPSRISSRADIAHYRAYPVDSYHVSFFRGHEHHRARLHGLPARLLVKLTLWLAAVIASTVLVQ